MVFLLKFPANIGERIKKTNKNGKKMSFLLKKSRYIPFFMP